MKSISVYRCQNFNITDTLPIPMGANNVGTISPNTDAPNLIIEQETFDVFNATFNVTIDENILVAMPESGELFAVQEYQIAKSFFVYYCSHLNLLMVDAPVAVAKKFIKQLSSNHSAFVNIERYDFDFYRISQIISTSKILHFQVNDELIDSKVFFGGDVHNATEAHDAIENNSATYLVAELDLNGMSRTIGFSKRGAIVIYGNPIDLQVENPYLQLALNAIRFTAN